MYIYGATESCRPHNKQDITCIQADKQRYASPEARNKKEIFQKRKCLDITEDFNTFPNDWREVLEHVRMQSRQIM